MSRERERRSGYRPAHSGHPTILYVRNISDRVRYDDLRHLFQKYGKIVDVTIPLDYYSGMPKGYCFVEFEDPRDAEEAHYRMARQRLFGREIEIEFARGDRKTASEMRTRAKDRRYGSDRYDDREGSRRERRGGERRRERSRSRSGGDRRRSPETRRDRSKSREANSYSRSRSRSNPRNKNHSPQPARSVSRDRSRTRSKSRASPRGEKMMNSRSISPA